MLLFCIPIGELDKNSIICLRSKKLEQAQFFARLVAELDNLLTLERT